MIYQLLLLHESLRFLHCQLLWLELLVLMLLGLLLILAVADVVRKEDGEVVPEVRLGLHLTDDLTDVLVEMLS